jgi:hypothetical protein
MTVAFAASSAVPVLQAPGQPAAGAAAGSKKQSLEDWLDGF